MDLEDYDTDRRYRATLRESTRITPDSADVEVRHMILGIPDSPFSYQVGQNIGVLSLGPNDYTNPRHFRLYSIAGAHRENDARHTDISICVRRCFYIDQVSGKQCPGISSNFLCDARPGDTITVTGPYSSPFAMPQDDDSHILMVGTGTGIAPFRAFIQHLFEERGGWKGQIRLLYGPDSGMERLYMNDLNSDIANYYQEVTFRAFEALSPRPHDDELPPLERALEDNAMEVWAMMRNPKTYVYVAGLRESFENFDEIMARIAGSQAIWRLKKEELLFYRQWSEILYE